MLDSLKQAGKNIGRELNRAWESLSDGWRELLSRCSNALVHYERNDYPEQEIAFPHWGIMAVELEETAAELIVRAEMPGVEKENCSIQVIGNTLFIRGEKRSVRETPSSNFYVRSLSLCASLMARLNGASRCRRMSIAKRRRPAMSMVF